MYPVQGFILWYFFRIYFSLFLFCMVESTFLIFRYLRVYFLVQCLHNFHDGHFNYFHTFYFPLWITRITRFSIPNSITMSFLKTLTVCIKVSRIKKKKNSTRKKINWSGKGKRKSKKMCAHAWEREREKVK